MSPRRLHRKHHQLPGPPEVPLRRGPERGGGRPDPPPGHLPAGHLLAGPRGAQRRPVQLGTDRRRLLRTGQAVLQQRGLLPHPALDEGGGRQARQGGQPDGGQDGYSGVSGVLDLQAR